MKFKFDKVTNKIVLLVIIIASIFIVFKYKNASPFLGDQLNQIQLAESLWKGRIKSLYGPYLSTTFPLVYPIGPLTAFVITAGMFFLQSVSHLHFYFSFFNILCLLYLFYILKRISNFTSNIFSLFLLSCPMYYFSLSLFWSNILIYGVTYVFAARYFVCILKPNWNNFIYAVLFFILGLHLHLIGVVLFPFIIQLLFYTFKNKFSQKPKMLPVFLCIISVLPYIIAEGFRKFANTKAIFLNANIREGVFGLETARLLTFSFFNPFMNMNTDNFKMISIVIMSIVVCVITITIFILRKRNRLILRFFVAAILSLLLQSAFFYRLNQPYRSPHYGSYLFVFSILFFAFLFYWIFKNISQKQKNLLSIVILLFPIYQIHNISKQYSDWNYQNIVSSLNIICSEYKEVRTFELNEFRTPEGDFYTVLEYIIKNNQTNCKYSEKSNIVLIPDIHISSLAITKLIPGNKTYELLKSEFPGIGVFKQK